MTEGFGSERNRRIATDIWHDFTALQTATGDEVTPAVEKVFTRIRQVAVALDALDEAAGREFTQDAVHFTRIERDGDYDGSRETWYATGPSVVAVRDAVAEAFAPYSCGPHAYDCCGRIFRAGLPEMLRVTRSRYGLAQPQAYIIIDRLGRDV